MDLQNWTPLLPQLSARLDSDPLGCGGGHWPRVGYCRGNGHGHGLEHGLDMDVNLDLDVDIEVGMDST